MINGKNYNISKVISKMLFFVKKDIKRKKLVEKICEKIKDEK